MKSEQDHPKDLSSIDSFLLLLLEGLYRLTPSFLGSQGPFIPSGHTLAGPLHPFSPSRVPCSVHPLTHSPRSRSRTSPNVRRHSPSLKEGFGGTRHVRVIASDARCDGDRPREAARSGLPRRAPVHPPLPPKTETRQWRTDATTEEAPESGTSFGAVPSPRASASPQVDSA